MALVCWAGIAQLVEYKLPKLGVASSNLVARSTSKAVGLASLAGVVSKNYGLPAFASAGLWKVGLGPLFFLYYVREGRSLDMVESATLARIILLAEPVLADLGCELVEAQLRNERAGLMLRFIVHKPGGVGLEDCATVSRALGALLEVEDPIGKAYHLEVSSPGLDRPLTSPRDFARNVGEKVEIAVRRGEATVKAVGVIAGVDGEMITITGADGPEEIALAELVKARLVIEF